MSNREDMIAEATDLGIEFKGNISNIKLAQLIAEYKGQPAPVEETAPAGPAIDPEYLDEEEEVEAEETSAAAVAKARVQDKFARQRELVAKAKAKAMKTHVVTITNKDNRENDVMTTAYLSFENQHFGLARLVPLDVPVQLEAALIHIAANCTMTMHKDEIVDGRRTGNKVPTRVKKYAISYSSADPDE